VPHPFGGFIAERVGMHEPQRTFSTERDKWVPHFPILGRGIAQTLINLSPLGTDVNPRPAKKLTLPGQTGLTLSDDPPRSLCPSLS